MVITITLFIVLQLLIKIKSPALFTIKNKKWKYGVLLTSLIYHDISPSKIEENDKYYYFWQQPIYVISKQNSNNYPFLYVLNIAQFLKEKS